MFAWISPIKKDLDTRMNNLPKSAAEIKDRQQRLSTKTLTWAAREKSNREALAEHAVKKEKALATLNELKAKNDACEKAIASGNKENMKAICGIQFDGNTSKPTPKLKPSTGVKITPNK